MNKTKSYRLLIPLIIFSLILSCKMDHGIEPIRSGINGTIHYIGDWPENTAEVRVVAATKFPPSDINDLIIGDVLPIGDDSTAYTFYLKPGDYYLGLVWRARDAAWGIQSIFGIYYEQGDPFSPGKITIPDGETVISGKDLLADFSKARIASNSSISGTVTFQGTWPENVEGFMVIATPKFPPNTLLDLSFSSIMPGYVNSADYFIPASPDTYKVVAAVLKINNEPWALNNLIGFLLKENSIEPQEVIVPTSESQIEGIDFTIKFHN